MSYSQGLSGLNAASSQLSVIGNNVANANTVGFKGSQAQFGDVYAAALSGSGSSQIGIGVKLQDVAQQFTQGNITATNSSLDMAVNGPGFFIMNNAQQGTSYSRNGQFQLDKNGYIVNSSGDQLQGYAINPLSGKPVSSLGPLNIPTAVASAAATGASTGTGTKGIVAGLNLDSSSLPPTSAFNPTDPTTFNNSTSTTTYDSKGVAQTTTMYFVKQSIPMPAAVGGIVNAGAPSVSTVTVPATAGLTVGQAIVGAGFPPGTTIATLIGAPGAYTGFTTSNAYTGAVDGTGASTSAVTVLANVANQWQVYSAVSDPTTGASLFPLPAPAAGAYVANGILTFGADGTYSSFLPNSAVNNPGGPNAPTPPLAAGVSGPDNTTTSISFVPAGATSETIPFSFTTSTQFGATFGVNSLTQDGFTSGQLSGFSIGSDGIIQGRYSNGQTKSLGQVVLATFPNNQGLQPLGSNEWAQTAASGGPVNNAPGSGTSGVLQTSATEDSSVDLTTELVNMMTAQRYYQANAQTIKTQDSVMQTLINMR